LKYIEEYDEWERERQRKGQTSAFALAMNLLQAHPAVVDKTYFCRIRDKSDVQPSTGEPVLDCTNGIDYSNKAEDTPPEVNFAPKLNGVVVAFRTVLCGGVRFMGAFQGQWGTGYAAMSHALCPTDEFDSTSTVAMCGAQCHSAFFFGRYHAVSKFFLNFQFFPTSVQFAAAILFDCIMRLLALTGFTWLFFYAEFYSQNPHCSAEQSFNVIKNRWDWFSKDVNYASSFPAQFDELPGVPVCFSYHWMQNSANTLRLRMLLTVSLLVGLFLYLTEYNRYTVDLLSFLN